MEEGLLSLKWNNHKVTFFNLFQKLRQKGTCTDVTLSCGHKFFNVHKLILMACSDFFCELFEHTTCKNPVVVLKDVKSVELEALLDYMYIGEVEVQQKNLPEIIKAAESLRIKGLAVPDDDFISPQENKDKIKERPCKRKLFDNCQNSINKKTSQVQSSRSNQNNSTSGNKEHKTTPDSSVTQKDVNSLDRCNMDYDGAGMQTSLFDANSTNFHHVNIKVEDFPQMDDNLIKNEDLNSDLSCIDYNPRNNISSTGESCSDAGSNDIQSMGLVTPEPSSSLPMNQSDPFGTTDQFSLSTPQSSDLGLDPQLNSSVAPHMSGMLNLSNSNIPFCPHCHRTFSDRYKRDRHLLIHTGEKPYRCPVCPYKASRKDPVVRHFRLRHRQDTQELISSSIV